MKSETPAPIVTSCKPTECESGPDMLAAKATSAVEPTPAAAVIAARIRAFIEGETDGEELLHALYDYVLDEPIPPRLLALLAD